MPGCAAMNCSNRSERGRRLFVLPTNVVRRAQWIENMGRAKYQPSKYARICEIHFEESQFETKRLDGWRKLKPNAVPTIFNAAPDDKAEEPPKEDPPLRKSLRIKIPSTITALPTMNIVDVGIQQLPKYKPTPRKSPRKKEAEDSTPRFPMMDNVMADTPTGNQKSDENRELKEQLNNVCLTLENVIQDNERLKSRLDMLENSLQKFLSDNQVDAPEGNDQQQQVIYIVEP